MKNGVDDLEAVLRDARGWLDAVAQRLKVHSPVTALQSLRATLMAVRAQLDPPAVIALGGELPTFVRALWYDGWRPRDRVRPATRLETFMGRVEDGFGRTPSLKAERAEKAALSTIFERVPAAVMAPVIEKLPEDLATLWPDEALPYTDLRQVQPLVPEIGEARQSRASPSRLRRATRRAPGEAAAPKRLKSAPSMRQ